MDRRLSFLLGLVVLVVLFFAINILAAATMRSARIDLTENNLYTLSEGSRAIARNLEEPVRLRFFFSKALATGLPGIQNYAQRVREMLEEYVRASGGTIVLDVIDPEPFSVAEDEAVEAGVQGVTVSGNQRLYFGLVGTNAVDDREVIPFFDARQEQFLEYRLSRLIHSLSSPERPSLAVVSSLPLDGGAPSPMGGPADPPWQIMTELRHYFDVEMVANDATEIPPQTSLLLIVHPKNPPEALQYAIDQFVLGGGRAVVFVDPNVESELPPVMQRQDPMARFQLNRMSDLKRLLDAWGVGFDPTKVAGDLEHAMTINYANEPVSYVAYLSLDEEAVNEEDPVTGRLRSLNMATAGVLTARDGAATSFEPLVQTSPESMQIDTMRLKFGPNPADLLASFEPSGERLTLAARVSGSATTAFPDGRPTPAGDELAEGAVGGEHLATSSEPINVIVVADVDMLADGLWLRQQRLGPIDLGYSKIADNGDLLVNALDNLSGSSELISVRARGQYARPFDYVEELQKESEQEYRAEEQRLQEKLDETEQRLTELQQSRPDQGGMILTPEQQEELDRFNEQRLETRKQLRAVQLNLRKDIENLGTRLKILNIVVMPLAVAILAVVVGIARVARRRSNRRSAAHT